METVTVYGEREQNSGDIGLGMSLFGFSGSENNGVNAGVSNGVNYTLTNLGGTLALRGYLQSNDNFWLGAKNQKYTTDLL